MARRIEVSFKKGIFDPVADALKKKILRVLKINLASVRIIEVYNIEFGLFDNHLKKLGEELFTDPITQEYSFREPLAKEFNYLVEVGFEAGVSDGIGKNVRSAIKDLLGIETRVHTSKEYLLKGKITRKDAEIIAKEILFDDSIQKITIIDKPQKAMVPYIPKAPEYQERQINTINLHIHDKELEKIIKENKLEINLEDLKKIKAYFKQNGRDPTDVELHLLSEVLKEHEKNRIFNSKIRYNDGKKDVLIESLSKTHIEEIEEKLSKEKDFETKADEKTCRIKFNKEYDAVLKTRCYDSISKGSCYNASIGAILSINNEMIGKKVYSQLTNTSSLFIKQDDSKKISKKESGKECMMEQIKEGINDASEKSCSRLIDYVIITEDKLINSTLLFCSATGLVSSKNEKDDKTKIKITAGDAIIIVGEYIGKDNETQLSDALAQKKLLDFISEADSLNLFKSSSPNNSGLGSTIMKLCIENLGAEIDFEKVPVKHSETHISEVLTSKNQQNMCLVSSQENIPELIALSKRRNIDAKEIGRINDSGRFIVLSRGKHAADISLDFFNYEFSKNVLNAKLKHPLQKDAKITEPKDLNVELKKLFLKLNAKYTDAKAVYPKLGSDEGLIISHGHNSAYADINAYDMVTAAIDEAIRKHVACGGDLKNISGIIKVLYDYCESDKAADSENKLAKIVMAHQAIEDSVQMLGINFSNTNKKIIRCKEGKDSKDCSELMALVATIGKAEGLINHITHSAKTPGDGIYIIGRTKNELGGSSYFTMRDELGANSPKSDFKTSKKTYEIVSGIIKKGHVDSCIGVFNGGIGIASLNMLIENGTGAEIDLTGIDAEENLRNDYLLFSESQSRFIVTVSQKDKKRFEDAMRGCSYSLIGKILNIPKLIIKRNKKLIVNLNVAELKRTCNGATK